MVAGNPKVYAQLVQILAPYTRVIKPDEPVAAPAAAGSALTPEQLRRTGVHAKFGPMDVPRWLEFFLVHEAHHLYVSLQRLAEARGARR